MNRVLKIVLMVIFLLLIFSCVQSTKEQSPVADTVVTEFRHPDAVMLEPPPPPPQEERRETARMRPPQRSTATRSTDPIHTDRNDVTFVPDETSEVDNILGRLKRGGILFDSPDTMIYRKPMIVEVALYPSITDLPSPQVGQDTGTALISSRMEAQLTGQGFAFIAQTPETQAVSMRLPTKWSWQVTPLETGNLSLHLSMLAQITVEGKETPYVIQTFDKNIEVEVTASQRIEDFIKENWKWAWGALIIPLFGLMWKVIFKRKKVTNV